MRQLTIEIHGTGTHNRGAELMTLAIVRHLKSTFPTCKIVVPIEYGTLKEIYAADFDVVRDFSGSLVCRTYLQVMPKRLRRRIPFVDPDEVDVVLDASGFAFSDQWGTIPADHLIKRMCARGRRHQKLVFLPQAFGPFETTSVARRTRKLLDRATRVFARDCESLHYLQSLGTTADCRVAPDFTLSVPPRRSKDNSLPLQPFVAIVPNVRMMDKTTSAEAYLELLVRLPALVRARGLIPLIVLHDAHEDVRIVEMTGGDFSELQCVTDDDPRVLKWILGQAHFVVASRFHALVSALSQGVPAIGVGWSHKYRNLFIDFECVDFLLEQVNDINQLDFLIKELSNESTRQSINKQLNTNIQIMEKRVSKMWSSVDDIIIESIRV